MFSRAITLTPTLSRKRERESDPAPSPQYSGERAGVRGLRLAKLRFITNQETP
jgi:hypothetical protein